MSFAVITGMWKGVLGEGGQGLIALCLFVPFILFSGWAGPLADRHSKKIIAVRMKWLELPFAFFAGIGFLTGNFWITAIAMLALATQSTFFSPAKYGMIPELVKVEQVSQANGLLNMTTNMAVIVGMLVAGFVSDFLQSGQSLSSGMALYIPGAVLLGVAILGVVAIVWLPPLEPMGSTTQIPINPFSSYVSTFWFLSINPLSSTMDEILKNILLFSSLDILSFRLPCMSAYTK